MEPRIETLNEKMFAGKNVTMSLANNKTRALWQSFMPDRKEITNSIGHELYSIEVYPPHYFDNFSVHAELEKWAAVEVTDFNSIPGSMNTLRVPAGLYAVFIHRGPASSGPKTYEYILTSSLPRPELADIQTPALVINSNATGEFMHNWTKDTADALPNGVHLTLDGEWHDVPHEILAPVMTAFFKG